MAKTNYKKKAKNGKEYWFFRLRHENLITPKDIYAQTIKELETKIKAIKYDLDNNIYNNKEYFETFFKDWLFNTHMVNKKPSTKERYESIYRVYILDSPISNIRLKNLTPGDIQEYYSHLIKSQGKSVSSVKNLHKLVAPCIRYAYNSNRINKDFSKAIVLPGESECNKLNKVSDVCPFTLNEQIDFLDCIKGHKYEILFTTALDSGLRQGELFALTWNDIDFKNKCIYVNKTYKKIKNIDTGVYEDFIQTPKTSKGKRQVPIPSILIKKLKQYRIDQKELKLKMLNLYDDKNLVFSNEFGNYLDNSNVRKSFKKVLIDNDFRIRKFHDLRHTYATRLFELGEDPKVVQIILGHSSLSITLDTYTHVLDNLKENAVSKLDTLYNSLGAKKHDI